MQVHVTQEDICTLSVDAIVNPANSQGRMDGGVGECIRRSGGDAIQTAAMNAAPIAVGAAVVTSGGSLAAKYVIHAPIMDAPGMSIGTEHVHRAARAALIAADAKQFQVLGIPAMGHALGGVDLDEAIRALVEELRAHRKPFPETVYLVGESDDMVEAFVYALRAAQMHP